MLLSDCEYRKYSWVSLRAVSYTFNVVKNEWRVFCLLPLFHKNEYLEFLSCVHGNLTEPLQLEEIILITFLRASGFIIESFALTLFMVSDLS